VGVVYDGWRRDELRTMAGVAVEVDIAFAEDLSSLRRKSPEDWGYQSLGREL